MPITAAIMALIHTAPAAMSLIFVLPSYGRLYLSLRILQICSMAVLNNSALITNPMRIMDIRVSVSVNFKLYASIKIEIAARRWIFMCFSSLNAISIPLVATIKLLIDLIMVLLSISSVCEASGKFSML